MAPLKTNLLLNSLFNSSFSAIKPLPGKKNNFQEVSARVNSQPMICRKPNNSGVEVGMNQTFPSVGKTQLPTPPVNSSFPAIKPLPGKKNNFPEVSGRVNSQPMICRKPNNSGVEVGMNQTFPSVGKTQLPTPPVNSSFPAIKPLPGTTKNFPEVSGLVNSQPMTFRKPNENSSGVEVGLNRMFPSVGKAQLSKPRTHHDSSAVSACLKTANEDQFIERKSTQPMKVSTGEIRLDRRREFVPRRVAPAIPEVESLALDEDFLFKTFDSRMNVVLKKPKKELFLMNELIADTKTHRMTTRSQSGVQQKRPRETSSQETAKAIPRKKPRAPTKKAISRSARNAPAPASKQADNPPLNIPSPFKFTFRISDSPVEYSVVINSS